MDEAEIQDTLQQLYAALEWEFGESEAYRTALRCAIDDDARREWEAFLGSRDHDANVVTIASWMPGPRPSIASPAAARRLRSSREPVLAGVSGIGMALEAGDPASTQWARR